MYDTASEDREAGRRRFAGDQQINVTVGDKLPVLVLIDPAGADSGPSRVCRGGSWDSAAVDCRSARRGNSSPGYRHDSFLGFRVVRGP